MHANESISCCTSLHLTAPHATHTAHTAHDVNAAHAAAPQLGSVRVAFLARHGVNHRMTPSEVPYRANIYALKLLGVKYLLSMSACGSLRAEMAPQHLVLVDQFVDRTRIRADTFFGNGVVAHVAMGEPVCLNFKGARAHLRHLSFALFSLVGCCV